MKPYYQDEAVTIYHGDCREVLPEIAKAQVVMTDPPFFLPPVAHGTRGEHEWGGSVGDLVNFEAAYSDIFKEFRRIVGDQGQLYVNCHSRSYPSFFRICYPLWPKVGTIIWYKPTGRIGRGWRHAHEFVLHAATSVTEYTDGFRLDVVGIMPVRTMKREHPAEKPGELADFLLESVPTGLLVDPFMGAGTFLVAAARRGRKAIGIEIEERYCEIAAKRMAQAVLPLPEPEPRDAQPQARMPLEE